MLKNKKSLSPAKFLILASHFGLMESLQHQHQPRHLANDSFSYAWAIAADGLDDDHSLRPSSGNSRRPSWDTQDFDFGLGLQAGPQQPMALHHADQLFSDGLLLPLHLLPPPPPASHLIPARPSYSDGAAAGRKPALERWKRGSRKLMAKYVMGFLKPFCRRWRRRAAPGKVGPETMSCPVSPSSTPRTSNAYSVAGELTHGSALFDSNVESSIYEAVLHCKKSITGMRCFEIIHFHDVTSTLKLN